MIRIISATNEKDVVLGSYFKEIQLYLDGFLTENNLNTGYNNLDAEHCTHTFIDAELSNITASSPFVFVVYTHGNPSAFTCQGLSYVDKGNANLFCGSFVYSTACSAGKNLGPALIQAGCKAFIGFKEESNAFENVDYRQMSMNCDQSGLFEFLSSGKTLKECFESMKNYYNTHIDHLDELMDIDYRAELVANREALVLIGDENIKLTDFILNNN